MDSKQVSLKLGCGQDGMPLLVENGTPRNDLLYEADTSSCEFSPPNLRSTIMMESLISVFDLQQSFQNASGLVVELWMVPSEDMDDAANSKPIMTIGLPSESPFKSYTAPACQGTHLALLQRGVRVRVRVLTPLKLHHVVVQLAAGTTSVYIDGLPVIQGAPNKFDATLSTWNPMSIIQLFGNSLFGPVEGFDGSLSLVSMYSSNMNESQVQLLYEAGLVELISVVGNALHLVAEGGNSTLRQGETSPLSIGGMNISSSLQEWTLAVELLSMPTFGSLVMDEKGSVLQVGDQITLGELTSHIQLWHQPSSDDFFTMPQLTFQALDLGMPRNDSFQFRLIALMQDDLLAWSEPVDQVLFVAHVNHPPTLNVTSNVSIPEKQATGIRSRPRAYLRGIQVDDSDLEIDRMRVTAWTYNGTLTVGSDVIGLADFVSCRANQRYTLLGSNSYGWNCHGNGVSNRNMTFVASPNQVSNILSSIEYHGFHWDSPDIVVIHLYDGIGGSCLSRAEHEIMIDKETRLYPENPIEECFELTASVPVPGISRPQSATSSTKNYLQALFDFKNFGIADAIFWLLFVLFLLSLCRCCRKCMCCCTPKRVEEKEENSITDDNSIE